MNRTSSSASILFALALPIAAQSTWLNVSPLKAPSARYSQAMAYDPNRGVVVLFGGYDNTELSDTWEWDGHLWTQKTSLSRPSALEGAVMAYDPKNKGVLLFGGYNGKQAVADTWLWDGRAWTRLSPTNNPRPRYLHAMATDTTRGVVVLVGGYDTRRPIRDTWEWNGSTWIDRTPSSGGPEAIWDHGLAYDAERKLTILYGGATSGLSLQTWQWNGAQWTQRTPANYPSGPLGHAMAYDSARKRIVVFGGAWNSSNIFNTLTEWNGAEWERVSPRSSPPSRYRHAMVYDSRRRRMVVFGGVGAGGFRAGTWELVYDCFCVGEGHPGGGLPISCVSAPVLGSLFRVAFSTDQGKNSLMFVGPAPVTSPWANLSFPLVCSVATIYAQPLVTLPVAGTPAVLTARIPLRPKLAGTRVTLQGASQQLTGCFLASDALEVTLRFP